MHHNPAQERNPAPRSLPELAPQSVGQGAVSHIGPVPSGFPFIVAFLPRPVQCHPTGDNRELAVIH